MFSRLIGALIRAILVALTVAVPALLLPGVIADSTQIVALIGIFAATLTFIEYSCTYPGLVEFRDAPPFNRVRFVSLLLTLFFLSVAVRGQTDPTQFTRVISAVGYLIGEVIDFPYSPVRLVMLMLPPDVSVEQIVIVRTTAGLSYLISLLTLAVFLILLRLKGWPNRFGTFNVWINLPTFDPTAGGDVVKRLNRDARLNIALGFLLPFICPVFAKAATGLFDPRALESPQTLVWTMTLWAFLPASVFMRGIAMGRVADMIADQRRGSKPSRPAKVARAW